MGEWKVQMIEMNFGTLSNAELENVHKSLRAAVDGPFFPDWEFHTLFGLEREDVRSIVERWPNVDFYNHDVLLAVNNSLNNLSGYPHRKEEVLERLTDSTSDELHQLLRKLKGKAAAQSK